MFHFLILCHSLAHPGTPLPLGPGTCFLPLILDTSPSRNLGVLITHTPRADPPSVLPLPAPGACNQSQAPAGFSGWRLEVVPQAPLKGVAGLPGSPEVGTSSCPVGKSQDWTPGHWVSGVKRLEKECFRLHVCQGWEEMLGFWKKRDGHMG